MAKIRATAAEALPPEDEPNPASDEMLPISQRAMRRRPDWWQWDFAVSWHVLNRMEERGFTFSDIMYMLNRTTRVVDDTLPGRFRAFTRWRCWCTAAPR